MPGLGSQRRLLLLDVCRGQRAVYCLQMREQAADCSGWGWCCCCGCALLVVSPAQKLIQRVQGQALGRRWEEERCCCCESARGALQEDHGNSTSTTGACSCSCSWVAARILQVMACSKAWGATCNGEPGSPTPRRLLLSERSGSSALPLCVRM